MQLKTNNTQMQIEMQSLLFYVAIDVYFKINNDTNKYKYMYGITKLLQYLLCLTR